MKSQNLVWVSPMVLILNYLTSVIATDDCSETIEHGDRSETGTTVSCKTGYTKVKCTPPDDAVVGYDANKCELDVVSLAVAVALMVFLIVVAIILFSIIIRRYRKTRGGSHGAMYNVDSNDYAEHQFDTQATAEQDGYRRKQKENGDRIIEINMDDAATSNDFKYHEHKDEVAIENSDFVNGGYDDDGKFVETSGYGEAVGGYDIDAEKRSNRMIDIHDHDDDEAEIAYKRKSGKSKKNKSSKKKVKKSANESKQKNSTKLKKKQNTDEAQETEKDDASGMYAHVNKKPANDNISADGLYQSMEELNAEVPKDKPETGNKLTSVDKDVVDNTDVEVADEAVYAKVDREHIAMKILKRQQDNVKGRVPNGSPKTYNIPSTPGSHTTGSDEGYSEGVEAV